MLFVYMRSGHEFMEILYTLDKNHLPPLLVWLA